MFAVKSNSNQLVALTTKGPEMSKKKDKLDPRVRRTRKLLRDALIELIPERGFDSITVKEITDRATLNRATFYLHYRDKEDLLRQGMREIFDELTARSPIPENESDEFSYDATRQTIAMDFEHVQQYADFYRVMLGGHGVWVFINELQEYIFEETMARLELFQGETVDSPIEPDLVVHQLAAGYVGVIQWWLANEMPFTPEEMAEKLLAIYRDGTYRCLGYEVEVESFRIARLDS